MINRIINRLQNRQFTLMAEIGVNYYDIAAKLHITSMEAAKLMVLSAHNAGVHAVKFQTYKAETLASRNSPAYWDTTEESTTSQYALFKKFDSFGKDEYQELSSFCDSIGIEFCSTPFDFESADYLYDMMNVYKISSSDLTNLPFIKHMAQKQKPILLSVGASNIDEIKRAVQTIQQNNNQPVCLLHCVLEYPTPYEHANLMKIATLKKEFPDLYIGYSDHTKPDTDYDVVKMAYLLGADLVEKHFTLDKSLPGNDHYHAMDEKDAENIIKGVEFLQLIRGNGELSCLESEQSARENARRSIVAKCDIPAGTVLTEEMLTFKRPGTGISPMEIEYVVGQTAVCDIAEDDILTRAMFDGE